MSASAHIERLRAQPDDMVDLDFYNFEAVVAELLAGFGWQVSVTPRSRDGGYDILGVVTDPSGLQTSWVVECKRYRKDRPIGVELVRGLVGVKSHIGVPNCAIVTSSTFTRGALDFAQSRSDTHLIDYRRLTEWVQAYKAPTQSTSYTESRSFASCFVSYSTKDEDFVRRLVAALKHHGVQTWYAPDDLHPGDKIYDQVKGAIASFDRLIVVLSDASLDSSWVESEIALAMTKEAKEQRRVLFPIALVDFDRLRQWELFDPDSGSNIARKIREYYIPNFATAMDGEAFNREVAKIVAALSAPAERA